MSGHSADNVQTTCRPKVILDKMHNLFLEGNDIICPSRFMDGGKMENCPLIKYFIVKIISFSLYNFSKIKVKDPTNGFRLFSNSIIKKFEIKSIIGFTFSIELLAKAYRFVADPRDDADESRLAMLNEAGGMWDCTRCMQCVEVCPKGVAPMDRIMSLRDKGIESGLKNTYGARHAEAFAKSVKSSGWLDELRLPINTFGITNVKEMVKMIPLAIRSQRAGKVPPLLHHKRPGAKNVERIFDKLENEK